MYSSAHPLYLHVRTPLHAGSGADLGVVDLPIQREGSTGYPKIEGSSLKGATREAFRNVDRVTKNDEALLFGPDSTEEELHAGAIGLTDARLLLFPVKSVRGVFAWVTSPRVLRRLKEDLAHADVDVPWSVPPAETVASGNGLSVNPSGDPHTVVLEEYAFEVEEEAGTRAVGDWIAKHVLGQAAFPDRFVVLDDDSFRDFAEMNTEIITRTKIDSKTGTVAEGQLFTEEYLPAESVLYALALASPLKVRNGATLGGQEKPSAEEVLEHFTSACPETVQIGANATIGKGLVRVYR